ncbi:glycosyltransferase family 9 protein [Dokdonella sp.]|uniref:glycosyltransferase family 9 protein n=1 Tax=Dokdonella sp. TaxID=2291710 RepID=UPI0031BF6C4D|nr:glycosyltransferase family 9 protein [Dokdonella sp.]
MNRAAANGRPFPAAIGRILIIKWSALGDIVLASAAMQDIRQAFPEAELHLDTLPQNRHLFDADPRFAAVVALPMRARRQRLSIHRRWLQRVRAAGYDLIIDLQSTDHTRLLVAGLAFGRHRVPARWGLRSGFPYTLSPPAQAGPHPAQRARALLARAGLAARTIRPVLHVPPGMCERVARLRERHGLVEGRYAILLPGSQARSRLRRWGVERYAELALLLQRRGIDRIALIGARDEAEDCARIIDLVEARAPGAMVLLDDLAFLEVIPACAGAACIIANDTGTAHVAAAAGRPLWVICGPTDPRQSCPLGARAIQGGFPCADAYRPTCRFGPDPPCLAAIAPTDVLALALGEAASVPALRLYEGLATSPAAGAKAGVDS